MSDPDLEARVLALLDGSLDAAELRALEGELLGDAEARAAYRRCVKVHSALETRFQSRALLEDAGVVPVGRIIKLQRQRVVRISLLSAVAVLTLAAIVLWWVIAPSEPRWVLSFESAPGSKIAVSHAEGAEGADAASLAEGSRLRLEEGTVECTLHSGVRAVLKAPCELRVLEENRLRIDRGVAWFHVPERATGFTIETAEFVVVDLGTEFGVIAGDEGGDEVHVFDGSVEVTALVEGATERLTASEGRRLSTAGGALEELVPDLGRFRTGLQEALEVAVRNHSFEDDVLPRDGDTGSKGSGADDYNTDIVPSGWQGFDDREGRGGNRGLLSTAPDSYFARSLQATPDADANDQCFYSAARDIYQVLDEAVQPRSTYTLTVDIGDRAARGRVGHPGNPGLRLGAGRVPGEGLLTPAGSHFPTQEDGGWVPWTVTFRTGERPAGLGEPLRIELTSSRQVGWFDNVRLTVTR